MNILVTGSNGQLGKTLYDIVFEYQSNDNWLFVSHKDLDITDSQTFEKFVIDTNIDIIVNCAAYTNVNKCETDKYDYELALNINNTCLKSISEICVKHNIKLIHISTDYVFNGENNKPYTENDKTCPLNNYGATKLLGEQSISSIMKDNYMIIRTSWLYSKYGHNFVKTILENKNDEIRVVYDQISSPTNAYDLAYFIYNIISNNELKTGIYHFSNNGICSWFDFAVMIKHLIGENNVIVPIKTPNNSKVKRPSFSVLDKTKIEETFGIRIPNWIDSLKRFLSCY